MYQEEHLRWHSLEIGDIRLKYHLRQPAPDQWNAVAMVDTAGKGPCYSGNTTVVVGLGRSPDEAVKDAIATLLNRRSQLMHSSDAHLPAAAHDVQNVDLDSSVTSHV